MSINPYITLDGTTESAMKFYSEVFETEIKMMMRFGEMPEGADQLPDEIKDRIAHAQIEIGGRVLMVSDHAEAWAGPYKGVEGFSVHVEAGDPDKAHALFAKLSSGGEVGMPIDKTFWARAFGTCRDKFGVPWMVSAE